MTVSGRAGIDGSVNRDQVKVVFVSVNEMEMIPVDIGASGVMVTPLE